MVAVTGIYESPLRFRHCRAAGETVLAVEDIDRLTHGIKALQHALLDSMIGLAVLLTGSRSTAEEIVSLEKSRVESRSSVETSERDLQFAIVDSCRRARRGSAKQRDVVSAYSNAFLADDFDGAEFLDALVTLKWRERFAVVLRYYCDHSDDEIARSLRCTRPTARELIARGMRNLERVMPDE